MYVVCHYMIVGDGRLGYPEVAPFNAIHVGAAAHVVPQAARLYNHSHREQGLSCNILYILLAFSQFFLL